MRNVGEVPRVVSVITGIVRGGRHHPGCPYPPECHTLPNWPRPACPDCLVPLVRSNPPLGPPEPSLRRALPDHPAGRAPRAPPVSSRPPVAPPGPACPPDRPRPPGPARLVPPASTRLVPAQLV